jgi:hypothetical protein
MYSGSPPPSTVCCNTSFSLNGQVGWITWTRPFSGGQSTRQTSTLTGSDAQSSSF